MDKKARLEIAEGSEEHIVASAVDLLAKRLPPTWIVQRSERADGMAGFDLVVRSPVSGGQASLLVEVRRSFQPRDLAALTGGLFYRLRDRAGKVPILLMAQYLSPRSREMLAREDINFIDLTGNVRLLLEYPGLFVTAEGAQVDPAPTQRRARGLRGAKVGAVVRTLVDAVPPYTGAQLARAANVNEGYLSRILETLADEGLVERTRSGPVVSVDWSGLLRQRAAALTLLRASGTFRYVARDGTRATLEELARVTEDDVAVTGSFAAARLAPVAPSVQLIVYTMNPRDLADRLRLVEVESGADTVLIRPDNRVALRGARRDATGAQFVAPSQIAIDCLSGPGRMPAEGEAVLSWMLANERTWRVSDIQDLT